MMGVVVNDSRFERQPGLRGPVGESRDLILSFRHQKENLQSTTHKRRTETGTAQTKSRKGNIRMPV
jgi:hypothetical protein